MKAKKPLPKIPKAIIESQDKYMSKQEIARRATRRKIRFNKLLKKIEDKNKDKLEYRFQQYLQRNPSIKNTKAERLKFKEMAAVQKLLVESLTIAICLAAAGVIINKIIKVEEDKKALAKNGKNKKRLRKPKKSS